MTENFTKLDGVRAIVATLPEPFTSQMVAAELPLEQRGAVHAQLSTLALRNEICAEGWAQPGARRVRTYRRTRQFALGRGEVKQLNQSDLRAQCSNADWILSCQAQWARRRLGINVMGERHHG